MSFGHNNHDALIEVALHDVEAAARLGLGHDTHL
jgi:hypothetical protein